MSLFQDTHTIECMAKHIDKNERIHENECSGATMRLVKIYKDRVLCINCGNSRVIVYKNEQNVFLSKEHNSFNLNERRRLEAYYPSIKISKTNNIKIVPETKMISVIGEYIDFPSGVSLMTSQALGHNSITGYAPDYETIYYTDKDSLKIIVASDGFWDMVLKDNDDEILKLTKMRCKDLLDFAAKRWLQEWEMFRDIYATMFMKCSFDAKQCDDVGIATVDMVPN